MIAILFYLKGKIHVITETRIFYLWVLYLLFIIYNLCYFLLLC